MTTTLDTDLEVFAAAVRRELHDLGPDVIDELTDGLEADLADSLADGGELGDPVLYAAELRAAAGLDPRGRRSRRPSDLDAAAKAAIAELRSEAAGFVSRHPAVRGVVEFFASLRPVWWVLRAWVLFALVNAPTQFSGRPDTLFEWMLLACFVLLSVQWGRVRWLPWRVSRPAVVVLSVIALLALPVVLATTANLLSQQQEYYPEPTADGIYLNSESVTNIFAYGADGELLTDVRLFDQDGDPLTVWSGDRGPSYFTNDDGVLVPSEQVAGSTGWNVYPLESVSENQLTEDGAAAEWARRTPADAPFASLQQLLDYEAQAPTE